MAEQFHKKRRMKLLESYGVYVGTFSKYYKISQLIHTQNVAN